MLISETLIKARAKLSIGSQTGSIILLLVSGLAVANYTKLWVAN